jgi:hypothetical protein
MMGGCVRGDALEGAGSLLTLLSSLRTKMKSHRTRIVRPGWYSRDLGGSRRLVVGRLVVVILQSNR